LLHFVGYFTLNDGFISCSFHPQGFKTKQRDVASDAWLLLPSLSLAFVFTFFTFIFYFLKFQIPFRFLPQIKIPDSTIDMGTLNLICICITRRFFFKLIFWGYKIFF